jgi:hypothetical protein
MGAWGTSALENDTAQDFVESLKRTRKAQRADRVRDALQGYLDFDRRRRAGDTVTTPSAEVIADLRRDLKRTREWYSQPGMTLPLVIMPWLASPEAEEAYIAELSKPSVEDGIDLALQALAACTLLAAALDRLAGIDEARSLSACDHELLAALLPHARECLRAIPENAAFMDSWQPHTEAVAAQINALDAALR